MKSFLGQGLVVLPSLDAMMSFGRLKIVETASYIWILYPIPI